MEGALLYQLRTAVDKADRDARLLEDAMSGAGTKDELLLNRVIRVHWDRNYALRVMAAYKQRFGKDLVTRIRGETSGYFEKLLVACLGG